MFQILDKDHSGKLSRFEFEKCCKDYRVGLKLNDIHLLFDMFDTNRDDTISYSEFMGAIRGGMNQGREELVDQVFAHLDRKDEGVLDFDDVVCYYNAKSHPDVRTARKTEEEILGEFLDTFEQHHAMFVGP